MFQHLLFLQLNVTITIDLFHPHYNQYIESLVFDLQPKSPGFTPQYLYIVGIQDALNPTLS